MVATDVRWQRAASASGSERPAQALAPGLGERPGTLAADPNRAL